MELIETTAPDPPEYYDRSQAIEENRLYVVRAEGVPAGKIVSRRLPDTGPAGTIEGVYNRGEEIVVSGEVHRSREAGGEEVVWLKLHEKQLYTAKTHSEWVLENGSHLGFGLLVEQVRH